MFVRVPASSANLGPGFDALGLALTLYLEVGVGASDAPGCPAGARAADERHPAVVAFRDGGGEGPLWVRNRIPEGRGLGFSGAARVGGLAAVRLWRGSGQRPATPLAADAELLAAAARLEGHADNVAASLLGGLVATAGGRAVRIPLAVEPAVVVWVPESSTTSTVDSRRRLADSVPRSDAVFNVGRAALLVAALAAGRIDVLREATADRLHQDARFAARPASTRAWKAGLAAGAWCAWLSGSGPSVAMFCAPAEAEALAAAVAAAGEGQVKVLSVDTEGARFVAA